MSRRDLFTASQKLMIMSVEIKESYRSLEQVELAREILECSRPSSRAKHFEISAEDIPGLMVANDNDLTVALDVSMNDNLIAEGMARELVNRKDNGRAYTIFKYDKNHSNIEVSHFNTSNLELEP